MISCLEFHFTTTLTIFVHPHLHAFLQSAGLALVPVRFVHDASSSASLASVHENSALV